MWTAGIQPLEPSIRIVVMAGDGMRDANSVWWVEARDVPELGTVSAWDVVIQPEVSAVLGLRNLGLRGRVV